MRGSRALYFLLNTGRELPINPAPVMLLSFEVCEFVQVFLFGFVNLREKL
jgi:hypothetical protein